jgi:hypothetical protein
LKDVRSETEKGKHPNLWRGRISSTYNAKNFLKLSFKFMNEYRESDNEIQRDCKYGEQVISEEDRILF